MGDPVYSLEFSGALYHVTAGKRKDLTPCCLLVLPCDPVLPSLR